MHFETFLLYLLTWTLVALSPGPAVLFSMAQATRNGFKSSVAAVTGIQCGNVLFFACVAGGLGALLATATQVFTVLRFLGAAYLFYLGARMILKSRRRTANPATPREHAAEVDHRGVVLRGFLIQATNPKALLFVSALLPQFIDPHRPAVGQLAILLVTTVAIDFIVLLSYAAMAQRGAESFSRSGHARWLERVFGAALIYFGCRLLWSRK